MSVGRKTALLAAILAGFAWTAQAQQPQPPQQQPGQPGAMMKPGTMRGPMPGPGMMRPPAAPCGPGMMMGPMMDGPGQYTEGWIAFLKAELKITPDQETLWNAFADAVRKSGASMQGMYEQMMSGGMPATLPERLQWHEQMLANRLEALRGLNQAIGPLYDALSAEQRTTADSLMGMM